MCARRAKRPHPCDQLVEGERLRHVVVGTEREARNEIVDLAVCGEHEDPRLRQLAVHRSAYLVAVRLRKVPVEDYDVIVECARLGERASPVERHVHGCALAAQPAGDGLGDPRLVLGNQHAHEPKSRPVLMRDLNAVVADAGQQDRHVCPGHLLE